jgi:hypothetical protein
MVRGAVLGLAALCAGCAGSGYRSTSGWDGRRGYDGNGDYGYDVAASQAEARDYRALAESRHYPEPGTPDDPWGPYIQGAAARFQVPERWVREVMRQESGGHLYDSNGLLITSSAGALGLMQVMPQTYDVLRQHYGLGSDPYEPHDNIYAGTAYIREMYDRFGSPGFLAAYNAGPDRLDAYLTGGTPLPDETVNYLASIAPRLGTEVAMTGPLSAYAGGGAVAAYGGDSADRAYAGGGMTGQDYAAAQAAPSAGDASTQAYDGGGLVTPTAPTGVLTAGAAPATTLVRPAAAMLPPAPHDMMAEPVLVAEAPMRGANWAIQVGAFPDPAASQNAIAAARARAGGLLAFAQPAIIPVQRGNTLYRARLVGLSAGSASAACAQLAGAGMNCFTVPPGA